MKRLSIMIVAAGLLASGCASKGAGSLGPAPTGRPTESTPTATTPSPTVSSTESPTPTPSGKTVTFEVWFNFGDRLFVTERTVPFTVAVGQASLDALIAGPTAEEAKAAVSTSIPDGIRPDITALANGIATVDWNVSGIDFNADAGRRIQAQIVYTLTQYSTIQTVRFTEDGVSVSDKAFARKDFEDLLPAILVDSPIVGEQVSNPVTISGTANVFEAQVSVRILDENGNEIARTFTLATCGTGCRGDYSVSVSYSVDHEQAGTIEVLDYSAKDGSPENVMSIPVILTP